MNLNDLNEQFNQTGNALLMGLGNWEDTLFIDLNELKFKLRFKSTFEFECFKWTVQSNRECLADGLGNWEETLNIDLKWK